MPGLTCTICSEVYTNADVIYSTACGHIFHFSCMQQWRSRSTSCPQCREHNPTTHRIFLDFDETTNEQKLNEVKTLLDQTEMSRSELQLQLDEIERNFFDMQRMFSETEEKALDLESANQYLKAQNDSREEEISKLINNCNLNASEEAELLRVQLSSLEDRLKEIILELEEKSEECMKLRETSNKQEKLLERNELLHGSMRRQYEAVERGLKVQIEHLNEEITAKTTIIEKQKNIIADVTANDNSSEKCTEGNGENANFECEFQKQKLTQYIDNNSTEMLMQKLKLERELEKSLDKILELEECHVRNTEMLNMEIENLKADIERKDNEIINRKEEYAKMMNRLSTLGSKATEISLRKRNEVLNTKLEETRCELEKAFKSCAEKEAAIRKLNQSENLAKSKFKNVLNQEQLGKESSAKKPANAINAIIDQPLNHTSSGEVKSVVVSPETKIVTSVVMRGVPEGDIKVPLIDTILMYTEIMALPCKTADIKDVFKLERKFKPNNNNQKGTTCLVVKFATLSMKIKFLVNKEKLRTRGIQVSEFVDNEINGLLHYAKTLRSVGYSTVFSRNNTVFVKLHIKAPLIQINSKQDVDDLIQKAKYQKNESKDKSKKQNDELNEIKYDKNEKCEECDDAYYRQ